MLYIDDLKPNRAKKFRANRLEISQDRMKEFFGDSLEGTGDLLKDQLSKAEAKGLEVQVSLPSQICKKRIVNIGRCTSRVAKFTLK